MQVAVEEHKEGAGAERQAMAPNGHGSEVEPVAQDRSGKGGGAHREGCELFDRGVGHGHTLSEQQNHHEPVALLHMSLVQKPNLLHEVGCPAAGITFTLTATALLSSCSQQR